MVVDHEIPRRDEKKTCSSYIFGSENNFPFEIFMMVNIGDEKAPQRESDLI